MCCCFYMSENSSGILDSYDARLNSPQNELFDNGSWLTSETSGYFDNFSQGLLSSFSTSLTPHYYFVTQARDHRYPPRVIEFSNISYR